MTLLEMQAELKLLSEKIDFIQKQTENLILEKNQLVSKLEDEIRKNDIENRLERFSSLNSAEKKVDHFLIGRNVFLPFKDIF